MAAINRQWLINGRPLGRQLTDDDFKWVEAPVVVPGQGQVLVKNLVLSFDPAQKGWMENIGGYVAPTQIGEVMRGRGVGEVIDSQDPRFKAGDKVAGMLRWQDYAIVLGDELEAVADDGFLTANLGALGTTGMTAYFGLHKIGRPFPGDTVVITGARAPRGRWSGRSRNSPGAGSLASPAVRTNAGG